MAKSVTTIKGIYAAINPLPAKLSEKGKVKPEVDFRIEANAGVSIHMSWRKPNGSYEWDKNYECFIGDDLATVLRRANTYIAALPSAEQARLNQFMTQLGKVIDSGKEVGIDVEYLNPLLDTMKRLSENALTYKPSPSR